MIFMFVVEGRIVDRLTGELTYAKLIVPVTHYCAALIITLTGSSQHRTHASKNF